MRLLIFSLQHKKIKKKIRGYKTIHTFTKRIEDKTTDNNNNNNINSINNNNNNNNNNNDNNSNNNDKTKTKNIKSKDPIKEKKLKTNQKRIPLFC